MSFVPGFDSNSVAICPQHADCSHLDFFTAASLHLYLPSSLNVWWPWPSQGHHPPPHLHHHHHHQTHHSPPHLHHHHHILIITAIIRLTMALRPLCVARQQSRTCIRSRRCREDLCEQPPTWSWSRLSRCQPGGDFLLTVRMMTMMMTMVRKALLIPSVNVEGRGRGKGEQQPQGRHPKPAPNLWKKKCLYFDAYPVFILTPTPHLWKRV